MIHVPKLTITLRREVEQAAETLRQDLGALLSTNSKSQKLQGRVGQLEAEVAAAENELDTDDAKAVQALGAKKVQLGALRAQLDQIPIERGTKLAEALRLSHHDAHQLSLRAFAPTMEQYVAGIAKQFRPFCDHDELAVQMARETPAAKTLGSFLFTHGGTFGGSVTVVYRLLALFDELLAGEINWAFDPNRRR